METEIRETGSPEKPFAVFGRSVGYDGARGHWGAYANYATRQEAESAADDLRNSTAIYKVER